MLDPANDSHPQISSPTNSSLSSSDLDTESTGSFFHDRSTTLGTLMGVQFPAITFRAPSQSRETHMNNFSTVIPRKQNKKKNRRTPFEVYQRRRKWWRLCSDGDTKPSSLGEFLEVERRYGDGAFFSNADAAAELEGQGVLMDEQRNGDLDGRVLFADGRVLPPAGDDENGESGSSSSSGILCSRRFSVSLTGICSGCVG